MIRRPPRSTRTDTRFPYTTLFRSVAGDVDRFADGIDSRPFVDHRARGEFPRPVAPFEPVDIAPGTNPGLAHPVRQHVLTRNAIAFAARDIAVDIDQLIAQDVHSPRSAQRPGGNEGVRKCRNRW